MKLFEKAVSWVAERFQVVKNAGAVVGAAAIVQLFIVFDSYAALPAAVGTAFTDLNTDAMALVDLVWTVAIPVTVAFIILRLFKRGANSAT